MKRLILLSMFIAFSLVVGCDSSSVKSDKWYHLNTISTLEQGNEDIVYDDKGNLLSYSYYGYRLQISHLVFYEDSIRVFMIYSVWGSDDFVMKIIDGNLINQWHVKEGNNAGIIDFLIMNNLDLVFEIKADTFEFSNLFSLDIFSEEFPPEEEFFE